MRYQILSGGFPCGQHLIPAGTVIDTTLDDQWSTLVKHLRPPLTVMALDKVTWLWLKALYPEEAHQILTPPGKER
jgi:hypothetical protein